MNSPTSPASAPLETMADTRYLGKVREKLQETQAWNRDISDIAFVLRLLDASQSALAESRADVARLTDQRSMLSAQIPCVQCFGTGGCDHVLSQRIEFINEFVFARLRSPTATGEEYLSCGHHKGNIGDTGACEACNDIAAARAQGVREGIEKAKEAAFRAMAVTIFNQAVMQAIEALTTPEPQ